MSNEKMREEFEAVFGEMMLLSSEDMEWQSDRNCYTNLPVYWAWTAWQAALSSAAAAEPVATWNGYGMNEERQLLAELADLPLGTGLYTAPQHPAETYPLPDSLYPGSKDWLAADYAGRVEWLHSMYEASKGAAETEPVGLIDCLDALIGADTQDGSLQLAQRTFLPQVRSAIATQARPEAEDAARLGRLRRSLAVIGVVGQIDGHDVVRRLSVLDIADRRLDDAPTLGPRQEDVKAATAVITECRNALAEELSAWDIDPPLYHVEKAHQRCVEWLAAMASDAGERT